VFRNSGELLFGTVEIGAELSDLFDQTRVLVFEFLDASTFFFESFADDFREPP